MLTDKEGHLWIGTFGGGLQKVKAQHIRQFPQIKEARTVSTDTTGNYVLVGNSQGVHIFNKWGGFLESNHSAQHIQAFHHSPKDGSIWVGSYSKAFHYQSVEALMKAKPSFSTRPGSGTSAIALNGDTVIFSTYGEGLYTWTANNHLQKSWSAADGLPSNMVEGLFSTSLGLWVGSLDAGVGLIQGQNIKVFTKKNGLPSNDVSAVFENKDTVWIGTAQGMALYTRGQIVATFAQADGLEGRRVQGFFLHQNQLFSVVDGTLHLYEENAWRAIHSFPLLPKQEGTIKHIHYNKTSQHLYLATSLGLFQADMAQFKLNKKLPRFELLGFGNDSISITKQTDSLLQFPHAKNTLQLDFALLGFQNEQANTCEFQLIGLSDEWVSPTQARSTTFANLPSGNYSLAVRLINPDRFYSEPQLLFHFEVLAPW